MALGRARGRRGPARRAGLARVRRHDRRRRPRCAAHRRTPSSGWGRSPRRSPRCWSCSAATTGCSTSTTGSTSTCPAPGTGASRSAGCSRTSPACSASRSARSGSSPRGRSVDELLAGLAEAEAVLPPAGRYHYSNLAYALLGEVVARLRREPWEDVLREPGARAAGHAPDDAAPHAAVRPRLLHRPVRRPAAERAGVPGQRLRAGRRAVVDRRRPEPVGRVHRRPRRRRALPGHRRGDVPPAGDVRPGRLDASPGASGFMLHRRGERVLVGHDGAMPGLPGRPRGPAQGEGRGGRAGQHLRGRRPRRPRGRPRAARGRRRPGPRRRRGARVRRCRRRSRSCSASGGPRAPPTPSRPARGAWRSRRSTPPGRPSRRCSSRRAPTGSGWSPAGRRASCCGSYAGTTAPSTRLYWVTYPVTRDPRPFGA